MKGYESRPENVQWALERWEEGTGRRVDRQTADLIEIILPEQREILAADVRRVKVGPAYTNRNGVHERDVAAEKLGRTMVLTCANVVAGKFDVKHEGNIDGRPVEDVELPSL